MKCNATQIVLPILHFVFQSELNTLGVILKCYALFSPKKTCVWPAGIKSLLNAPAQTVLRFLSKRNSKNALCNKGLKLPLILHNRIKDS